MEDVLVNINYETNLHDVLIVLINRICLLEFMLTKFAFTHGINVAPFKGTLTVYISKQRVLLASSLVCLMRGKDHPSC